MSEEGPRLSYTLEDYDFLGSSIRVYRQAVPGYLRYSGMLVVLLVTLAFIIFAVAATLGYRQYGFEILAVIAIGYVAWVYATRIRRSKVNKLLASSPARKGEFVLTENEQGISISNFASTTTLYWQHIVDIVEDKDSLLIMLGGLYYFPISSTAFATPEDRAAILERLRDRISVAKETSA